MNPFQVFKYLVLAILVLLLCVTLFQSGLKYSKRNTSFQKTTVNQEKILYPSVSICRKYTFDNYIDEDLLNPTVTLSKKQDLIRNNSWLRERAIFFLGHAGMLGLTYPCLTTMGGTDSAKLCSFPSPNYFSSPCDFDQSQKKVCYTRMTDNGTKYFSKRGEQKWGYCPKDCHGEKANWSSPFNLASRDNMWASLTLDRGMWVFATRTIRRSRQTLTLLLVWLSYLAVLPVRVPIGLTRFKSTSMKRVNSGQEQTSFQCCPYWTEQRWRQASKSARWGGLAWGSPVQWLRRSTASPPASWTMSCSRLAAFSKFRPTPWPAIDLKMFQNTFTLWSGQRLHLLTNYIREQIVSQNVAAQSIRWGRGTL